jgi:periplasmic protein TonB
MKTKNQFNSTVAALGNLSLVIILTVFAAVAVTFTSCQKNTKSAVPAPPEEIYTQVDELPVFTGGDQALLKFIAENTKYPEEAKLNNITGKVVVRFVVEKDGSVSNVDIVKGADPQLDAEAIRVVKTLPKFEKPAKNGGEIVRVHYMVPIMFALK